MTNLTFVIYGAASDIIAPIYDKYTDANFICLINKNKPSHIKGKILETNLDSFDREFSMILEKINKNSLIVYINAAVYQKDGIFISNSETDIEMMIDVGIKKNLKITKLVLGEMVKRKWGRLINLSSFRSKAPTSGAAIYASIKSFTDTFFKTIGLEYGRFDITSNTISLGFAESKLLDTIEKENQDHFKKLISKNKFLPSRDFISTLNYIIRTDYLNSSIIDLDGGLNFLK
tara:strand:+ start:81 stop:776 length:696 start_codon:yes stop_codon:yes gene_type:complete